MITILFLGLIVASGGFLSSCTGQPLAPPLEHPHFLLNMPKATLLNCAGMPSQEITASAHVKQLKYYREQSMLNESLIVSKSSTPGRHHGCWARILLEDDKVTGVEYLPVPEGSTNNLCEEIFTDCVPNR